MGWGLRIKKLYTMDIHRRIWILGFIHNKEQYIGGFSEKGGLGLFADLRGGLAQNGVVFLRGIDTQMHVMGN